MDTTEALALCSLAEEGDLGLRGLDAKIWRGRLETALDELQAAFEWALDHNQPAALRMASAMAEFWRTAGRIPEGREWLDRALAAGDPDALALPRALYENALLAFWQGDDDTARTLLERSLDIARRLADPTAEAVALCGMARLELREGNLDRARALCEEALERVAGTDDTRGRSNALHVLGVVAQMRGDLHEAAQFMNRRMNLARELNLMSSVASEAGNLSVVERQLGNLERATKLALEALQISERRGDEWMHPYELNSLAAIAAAKKDFVRATTLLGAAARLMERMGTAWPPDEKPHFEATRSAAEAALEPRAFTRAWSAGERMSSAEAVSFARAGASMT
jgi:non-specific serine/threonine protein kinase